MTLNKAQIEFSAKTGTFYGINLWDVDPEGLTPTQLKDLITVIQLYNWNHLDRIDDITSQTRQILRDLGFEVYDEEDWL